MAFLKKNKNFTYGNNSTTLDMSNSLWMNRNIAKEPPKGLFAPVKKKLIMGFDEELMSRESQFIDQSINKYSRGNNMMNTQFGGRQSAGQSTTSNFAYNPSNKQLRNIRIQPRNALKEDVYSLSRQQVTNSDIGSAYTSKVWTNKKVENAQQLMDTNTVRKQTALPLADVSNVKTYLDEIGDFKNITEEVLVKTKDIMLTEANAMKKLEHDQVQEFDHMTRRAVKPEEHLIYTESNSKKAIVKDTTENINVYAKLKDDPVLIEYEILQKKSPYEPDAGEKVEELSMKYKTNVFTNYANAKRISMNKLDANEDQLDENRINHKKILISNLESVKNAYNESKTNDMIDKNAIYDNLKNDYTLIEKEATKILKKEEAKNQHAVKYNENQNYVNYTVGKYNKQNEKDNFDVTLQNELELALEPIAVDAQRIAAVTQNKEELFHDRDYKLNLKMKEQPTNPIATRHSGVNHKKILLDYDTKPNSNIRSKDFQLNKI